MIFKKYQVDRPIKLDLLHFQVANFPNGFATFSCKAERELLHRRHSYMNC